MLPAEAGKGMLPLMHHINTLLWNEKTWHLRLLGQPAVGAPLQASASQAWLTSRAAVGVLPKKAGETVRKSCSVMTSTSVMPSPTRPGFRGGLVGALRGLAFKA